MNSVGVSTLQPPVPLSARQGSHEPLVVGTAALLVLAGTMFLTGTVDWRQAALFLVGVAAGVILYHAAFGFTSSFRVFISDRRGAGLRAQMVMLAIACALFIPALASGTLFGQPVRGNVAPLASSAVVGAFLFGIGMQIGGGCASGTLFAAGGGNVRMLVTLFFFIVGSVLGVLHLPWWEQGPALPGVSLLAALGAPGAFLVSGGLFAGVWVVTARLERRRHGRLLEDAPGPREGIARFLRGPWPLVWGAVGLALVNFATLALAGRPWGITSAFALWGSKALAGLGVNVQSWPYWAARPEALQGSLFADVTSMMNVGLVLGALGAAGLAGRFLPSWRIPPRSLAGAIVGGLLLGYGARLALGCNIGAYFSGVASTSLHGWVWFVSALAGSVVGTRLRPFFGLAVEKTPSRC